VSSRNGVPEIIRNSARISSSDIDAGSIFSGIGGGIFDFPAKLIAGATAPATSAENKSADFFNSPELSNLRHDDV
jgi:hypothetical protein